MRAKLYELYITGTSLRVALDNYPCCIRLSICIEMGTVLIGLRYDAQNGGCPYCDSEHRYHDDVADSVVVW